MLICIGGVLLNNKGLILNRVQTQVNWDKLTDQ